jgi:hypothetical protein
MPIEFTLQGDGFYRAYAGGLEVKVCNVGYEINLWSEQEEADCEYDGCQSDDYDTPSARRLHSLVRRHDGEDERRFTRELGSRGKAEMKF